MEMCEDMVVDLNVRKRQCMDAAIDHPLNHDRSVAFLPLDCPVFHQYCPGENENHTQKRTCQGLASFVNTNGVLLNDCEMVYWHSNVAPSVKEPVNGFVLHGGIQQHCKPPQNPQICPRCLAGESGHINHILRL